MGLGAAMRVSDGPALRRISPEHLVRRSCGSQPLAEATAAEDRERGGGERIIRAVPRTGFGELASPAWNRARSGGRGWLARQCAAAQAVARRGRRGVFRRSAGFGVRLCGLCRPSVVCAGDPGRSRSIHNPACVLSIPLARLGSALPRCSVRPSCARGGEKRRPPSGA